MELSEFYESTILDVEAGFGFDDYGCDPDEITATLGLQPDQITLKGQPHVVALGKVACWPSNTWYIKSHNDSKDVNVHLRQLLALLDGVQLPFPKRFGQPGFTVVWKGNYLYAGSGPQYDADVLQGIVAMGASLGQDIYQIDQDENEPIGPYGLRRI